MKTGKNQSDEKETPDSIDKNESFSNRPIDRHGDYDGTDVGFTSTSVEGVTTNTNFLEGKKKGVRPINKHGNYDGTDVGFTSDSFSDKIIED